jgi:autotransporter-associated beta strand protein
MDEGTCCGGQWETGEGVCCGGQWETGEGECCDNEWHEEGDSGECCTAKTLDLLIVGCGNGAIGRLKWLDEGLTAKVYEGGAGYAFVAPVRVAPTLTVSGGSGTGLEVELTLESVSDECSRPSWRIASVSFSGGSDYLYIPANPGSGTPPQEGGGGSGGGGGTSNLGGGTTGGGAPANPGAGGGGGGEPYIPPTPAVDTEPLTVTAAEGDTTVVIASLTVTSNSSGTPVAVNIVNAGSYFRDTEETQVYTATPSVTVILPGTSGLGGGPAGLGGAEFEATVDSDEGSPTFGQVTEIAVVEEGTAYAGWDWGYHEHWYDEAGECCGDRWYTEEGYCCNTIWYPADDPCPDGEVFVAREDEPDCCGCVPEMVYDPETQQMVPTIDNEDLLACDCSQLYATFTEAGEGPRQLGKCCVPGEPCVHTFEDECEGEWLQECCEPNGCLAPCCIEDADGVASCEVRFTGQCSAPDVVGEGEDCETSCKGACCVDGVLTETQLSQEECDEAGGCWAGVGSEECYLEDECRPPLTRGCCESTISGASGLTFTQPRKRRCSSPSESPWLVTVTGTTDSEIKIHGISVGENATPAKRCPINVTFSVCWDKFNIEPMPCDTEFRRLDVTVCWVELGEHLETLAYSGCTDIDLWLGECNRNCKTVLTYGGAGVEYDRTVQIRGDATLEANGTGPLVFTAFSYPNACDIKLTLDGTSTQSNEAPALADPSTGTKLSLDKAGTGHWVLGSASTHTGQTSILSGTLIVSANAPLDGNGAFGYSLNGGLGGGSSPVVLLGGAVPTRLLLDQSAQVGRLIQVTSGTAPVTIGGFNGSGTTRFQSAMTFFVNRDVTLQVADGGTVEFANGWAAGDVGAGGPLEASFTIGSGGNEGVVLLSGNLSTSGTVTVKYGTLHATSSLSAAPVILDGQNATLQLELLTPMTSQLDLLAGTLKGNCEASGEVNVLGDVDVNIASSEELLLSGTLAGSGAITKAGSGTLRITATNTHSGAISVQAGTLAGSYEAVGSLYFANGTSVLVSGGDEIVASGGFDGDGTVTKLGGGTLRVSGSSSFNGTLNVQAGSVVVESIASNPGGLVTGAEFSSTALTVAFTGDPAPGSEYVLFSGSTTQSYGGYVTLTGTTMTGTYNSSTATITID